MRLRGPPALASRCRGAGAGGETAGNNSYLGATPHANGPTRTEQHSHTGALGMKSHKLPLKTKETIVTRETPGQARPPHPHSGVPARRERPPGFSSGRAPQHPSPAAGSARDRPCGAQGGMGARGPPGTSPRQQLCHRPPHRAPFPPQARGSPAVVTGLPG